MDKGNEWFAGEAEADGMRVIVRGRLFLKQQQQCGSYPMRAEVIWSYPPDPQGMPSNDELLRIDDQMNRLTETVEQNGEALLTAVHIGAGKAWFVYYTRNLDRFSELLDSAFSGQPPLPIQVGATRDTDWSERKKTLDMFDIDTKMR